MYSADDIERMRRAIDRADHPVGVTYKRHEWDVEIQERIRTYIAAGITADELEARAQRLSEERWADQVRRQREGGILLYPDGSHTPVDGRPHGRPGRGGATSYKMPRAY
jgi:hypothetical protein